MKKQFLKKLFAFLIKMFSISFLQAQLCEGNSLVEIHKGGVKTGCTSLMVPCSKVSRYFRKGWDLGGCPIGPFVAKGKSKTLNGPSNAPTTDEKIISPATRLQVTSKAFSNVPITSFSQPQSQKILFKIFAATGKLVKTLADSRMPKRDHQIEWNKRNEAENTINSGVYILQFISGSHWDRKKLSII